MILYINSCVREDSRTDSIARELLTQLGGNYTELNLEQENLKPLTVDTLNKRAALIQDQCYSDPMFGYAKQFASADTIVISAPFWDLSFPSSLKVYIENIYATGIVSQYGENGIPEGLCKASKLYYVTTAGGPYVPDYSFHYIRDLAQQYFGIPEVKLIKAEMLDVDGYDAQEIVQKVKQEIRAGAVLGVKPEN
ncbi:MAG: NAD(P)H-dependent oxidoreductase [Eubacteriales bacterium]|nr:NAD(P)H-dependent oxidoreductase [Eubacteriales bacterium]